MISIFAKRTFLNINPSQDFDPTTIPKRGHLMRVSSMIRADQIVEQIGARLNPKSGYENDVCIYVKPHLKKDNMHFKFERKSYLDIIDGHNLGQVALNYPKLSVIVCSQADYETMSKSIPNKIVLIPQHHCNFDRIKRTRKEVTTVGVVGTESSFKHLPSGLEKTLKNMGFKLLKLSKFFTRQYVVDFHKKIDVQIVWRPYKKILSNPLKLINASSFGIPTIALDEPAFKEMGHSYFPVNNSVEFLFKLDELRSKPWLYSLYAKRAIEKAEEYHIEKIGELYKELDK